MTTIKHILQREVFLPTDERLLGVVSVTKAGKKKKTSFLSIAVTTEKPVQVKIYQLKKSEKGETYKRKQTWELRELKTVDGKDAKNDTAEFDLQFEKTYKWVASHPRERDTFLSSLWKLCQRYLKRGPVFVNVPDYIREDSLGVTDVRPHGVEDTIAAVVDEDYQAITEKEEKDLETLMKQCEHAISNAEAFAEQLSKDLSVLDGANIHSIMGSEDQVVQLMKLLDDGVRETTKLETKLNRYDELLASVKEQMESMRDKDTLIHIQNKNHQSLIDELENLIGRLNLDHKHEKALLDGDLSTPSGIYESTEAAEELQKCMAAEIHPALMKMQAVQEQQKRFGKYRVAFAKRLSHHLNNLFIHQGNEMSETLSRHATDLKLPPHHSCHRDLTPYAELMMWLKEADPQSFQQLAKVYTNNLSRLYDKEVKDFFELAKQRFLHAKTVDKKHGGLTVPSHRFEGSGSSLDRAMETSPRGRTASLQSLDSADSKGSSQDLTRGKFDQVFEKILCELEPFCLAEQDFCVKFFHLTLDPHSDDLESMLEDQTSKHEDTHSVHSHSSQHDDDDIWVMRPQNKAKSLADMDPYSENQVPVRRQLNEEVRRMMGELFPSLESELLNFITFGDKLDSFNSMYMLVRMSQHVIHAQDAGSFLSKVFANVLVNIKRNFDRFILHRIKAVEEYRISKKNKCGVVMFVHHFEDFAHQAEAIFQGSDRRADLDKAYSKLIRTVFEQLLRISTDHPKTPKDVVLMENYHHLYATLSQLKISCLEKERKDARQRYQEHLQAYVTTYLGRPLEKLNTFFEGIESKVASGVKEDEVGYQLAYSKQELRKVIKEYPGKEVKKNLEHLRKKVEKHLCEEENLFQVVWHSMQDEFLKQYKHFEHLIAKCYPASNITLEFSVEDILQFFTDIAQA
ncbi:exocyst complex component 1 isoform X1 [Lingula anatina]|uniref:Exocyst complex component 1 isoform X1 n=1 Tax=Lingula anatina TaxID=7574 RepID=A0A1S3IH32_LINAN|nr:exocyst complex component 1 isoform X1 [Lingula anatina]|eukprot:XP_013397565.1 exocyst complex component 1 isoform X1 [Lingula anatina]